MTKDVWVFAEYSKKQFQAVTWEMLSEGQKLSRRLDGQICACLIGYQLEDRIDHLTKHGAEKVYLVDDMLIDEYLIDGYIFVLENLIKKYNPAIIMIGATPKGSELAPRIAARLRLPCVTEVKKIAINEKNLTIAKSGYRDEVYFNFDFIPKRTVILTVVPGDMEVEKTNKPKGIEIVREGIHIEPNMIRTENIKFIKGDPKKIGIEEAELIIAGGKGIGIEGMSDLEEIADLLGASIGGTRMLVDEGIIPFERQIGITGKSVGSKLMIACGISGAREFTAGTEKVQLTIAINTDSHAGIFNIADIGILGDVHDIVPALIKGLKKKEKTEKADEDISN